MVDNNTLQEQETKTRSEFDDLSKAYQDLMNQAHSHQVQAQNFQKRAEGFVPRIQQLAGKFETYAEIKLLNSAETKETQEHKDVPASPESIH